MNLPTSFTRVTPLSKFIALTLFVALPFIGFLLGMAYQKSQTPVHVVKINTPQEITEGSASPQRIRAGTKASFAHPQGWHVAINYIDSDLSREVFYIHPTPWSFNRPGDTVPQVLMNVYTQQDNPQTLYDSRIREFYSENEQVVKQSIPQKYFGEFVYLRGVLKEPSPYAGSISEMYIMKSSNPTYVDLSDPKSQNFVQIGPLLERGDNSQEIFEQILVSFEEDHFEE